MSHYIQVCRVNRLKPVKIGLQHRRILSFAIFVRPVLCFRSQAQENKDPEIPVPALVLRHDLYALLRMCSWYKV